MIKSQLISRIAKQNPGLFAKDVEKAVNTILDEIAAALVRSDRVELRGFGTFTLRTWGPRPLGRNPKTGAPINIPETHHPSFRTGKEMHHRLNGTLDAPRAAFHMRPNLLSRRRECSAQANGHDPLRNVRMALVRADGSEQALFHAVDLRESPTRFV
jgi:integration host factor subunit beta